MKRLLVVYVFTLCVIVAFSGCGGGRKDGEKHIKVVQTSGGGIAFMPNITIMGGVAYAADMVLGVNQGYVLYLRDTMPASFPWLDVYVEDDEGNRLDDAVNLVKNIDAPYVDCIGIHDLRQDRGVQFSVQQTRPGRCEIIAVSGELTRKIDFLVFDGYGNIPPDNGLKVDDTGHVIAIKAESAVYKPPVGSVILPGRSYLVANDYPEWRTQMKNIKTVDTTRMGAEDYILKLGDICVAECPGGHVKVAYIEGDTIWEFKPLDRPEFR